MKFTHTITRRATKKFSDDFLVNLIEASGNRLRFSGTIGVGPDVMALVDVMDASYRIIQSFRSPDLNALGWEVRWHSYGVEITKGKSKYVAMTWPIESWGRVSERQQMDMVSR
ncbi:MAG: hypothetical protein M3A44_00610 [Gammaproteobacteria bacterium]